MMLKKTDFNDLIIRTASALLVPLPRLLPPIPIASKSLRCSTWRTSQRTRTPMFRSTSHSSTRYRVASSTHSTSRSRRTRPPSHCETRIWCVGFFFCFLMVVTSGFNSWIHCGKFGFDYRCLVASKSCRPSRRTSRSVRRSSSHAHRLQPPVRCCHLPLMAKSPRTPRSSTR